MNVVCHIKDPIHREYLHALFAYEDGAFSVFRDTKVGRFIVSMVRHSDYPVEQKVDEERAVYFRLPRTSAVPSLFRRFSYIHTDDQVKINDYLIATFDNDFTQYYFVGKNLGLQQKIIIQNFILARKLVSKIGDIEQLKKRTYRSEEKAIKTIAERLAKRVRVQNAIITRTIQEIQQYQ